MRLRSRASNGFIVVGACDYAGLGKGRLKVLVKTGKIDGAPDPESGRGDLIIDRESLDRYRNAQLGTDAVEEALARLSS